MNMEKDYSHCIGKLLKGKRDQTNHSKIKGWLNTSDINQETADSLEKRTGCVKNM